MMAGSQGFSRPLDSSSLPEESLLLKENSYYLGGEASKPSREPQVRSRSRRRAPQVRAGSVRAGSSVRRRPAVHKRVPSGLSLSSTATVPPQARIAWPCNQPWRLSGQLPPQQTPWPQPGLSLGLAQRCIGRLHGLAVCWQIVGCLLRGCLLWSDAFPLDADGTAR